MSGIEEQVVRLVKEIAEDERMVVELRTKAADYWTMSHDKQTYTEQANRIEESLNRKMKLLLILKR